MAVNNGALSCVCWVWLVKQGSVAELVGEAEQALSAARGAGGNRTEVRILELPPTEG